MIIMSGASSSGRRGRARVVCGDAIQRPVMRRLREWSHGPVATAYGQKRPRPASWPTEGGLRGRYGRRTLVVAERVGRLTLGRSRKR